RCPTGTASGSEAAACLTAFAAPRQDRENPRSGPAERHPGHSADAGAGDALLGYSAPPDARAFDGGIRVRRVVRRGAARRARPHGASAGPSAVRLQATENVEEH